MENWEMVSKVLLFREKEILDVAKKEKLAEGELKSAAPTHIAAPRERA